MGAILSHALHWVSTQALAGLKLDRNAASVSDGDSEKHGLGLLV